MLSDDDKAVRDWFKAQCEALGCTVTVDSVGNMFARRAGKDDSLLPIAMGSHLDTQPAGGEFDGVLGALEALRTMVEMGCETAARAPRGHDPDPADFRSRRHPTARPGR
ncbi:MAG: hypothetical protein AB7U38_10945 [Hyphomicrobiales bacterium]